MNYKDPQVLGGLAAILIGLVVWAFLPAYSLPMFGLPMTTVVLVIIGLVLIYLKVKK